MNQTLDPNRDAAIFGRLFANGSETMSAALARYFLALDFSDADKARIHDLAVRNQDGALRPSEWDELQSYVRVGHLLAVLQAKARKALKKKQSRRDA